MSSERIWLTAVRAECMSGDSMAKATDMLTEVTGTREPRTVRISEPGTTVQ